MPHPEPARTMVASRWRDPFNPEPWARRVKRVAPDVERDETILRRLQAAMLEGDPLADAVASWLVESSGERAVRRAQFERAVDHGIDQVADAPEVLSRLFAHVDEVPAWLDRARIDRAKRLAQRVGIAGDYVLSCFALMPGYLAIGTAKVLARTGALERMARRRLVETSKFVADVYTIGPMDRFSDAVRSAIRVRVMHALVRRSLLADGWDVAAYGVPINQFDQCGTNLLFSITFTLGLRALGFVLDRQEREDIIHLWRYIGRLFGIADDLVPTTEREGRRLLRLVGAAQQGPDDDSRRLAAALRTATAARWEGMRFGVPLGQIDSAFRAGLTRIYVGDHGADLLGLPRNPWRFAILGVFPMVRCLELARRITPFGTHLLVQLNQRHLGRYLDAALRDEPPSYVPFEMRRSSGLTQ